MTQIRGSRRCLILCLFTMAAFVVACGGPQPGSESRERPPEGSLAATWDAGWIEFSEIEKAVATASTPACRELRRAAGGGSLEGLVPCYLETAEVLALEQLVRETIDAEASIAELLATDPSLKRYAFVEAWQRHSSEEIEIDDAEATAWFEANRERFRRPAQMTVSNIFRRHAAGAGHEQTAAFLRGIKARYEAGETFAALAREVSHSETRLRGGLVGRLSEGRLNKGLEEIALSLDDGGVSDPIPVRGGAILLHVTNVVEGGDFTLDEVRDRVVSQVRTEKLTQRFRERADGVDLPEDAVTLSESELLSSVNEVAAVDSPGLDEGLAILVIGDQRLDVATMRRLLGLDPGDTIDALDDDQMGKLTEVYENQVRQMKLLLDLLGSTEAQDLELRREAEENLNRQATARVVDDALASEVWRLVDDDEQSLRVFFEDNQPHYQSPLRFTIRSWDLPFDDDPPAQLSRMEDMREALATGAIEMPAALAELGGEVEDLGTKTLEELRRAIPNKARDYLLQTSAGDYSLPFQQDEALHILHVVERHEPRPQSYDEVVEKVREDYRDRFAQQLYRRVVEARLADVAFIFHEEVVRSQLTSG